MDRSLFICHDGFFHPPRPIQKSGPFSFFPFCDWAIHDSRRVFHFSLLCHGCRKKIFFDPQYVIPLGGMLLGNAMNSVSLGIKTFRETLVGQQARMEALACLGADSGDILQPFVIRALETAMVPTLNSMVGMGIVSLPGMMTGQILAGAPPLLAILYQISIMIAIASVVTLTSFASLYAGARTLYDKRHR